MRTVHTTCERCGQDRACHLRAGEWVCESCQPLPAELPGQLTIDGDEPTSGGGQTEEIPY